MPKGTQLVSGCQGQIQPRSKQTLPWRSFITTPLHPGTLTTPLGHSHQTPTQIWNLPIQLSTV